MEFLVNIRNKIKSLGEQDFYRYTAIFLGILALCMCGIFFYYYSKISTFQSQIKKVNRTREDAQVILKNAGTIKQINTQVNNLMNQEKNFKIKSFFDGLVQKLNLTGNLKRDPSITEEKLNKQYSEIKITAQFTKLNTKQVTQLLQAIEQKKIVYTKEMTILHKGDILDVTISVATIKPQSGTLKKN